MKIRRYHIPLIFLLSTAAGCATVRVPLQTFDAALAAGDTERAREIAGTNAGANPSPRELLWVLQTGAMDRILQRYEASNSAFDRAEQAFAHYDQQLWAGRSAQTAGGLLINDTALPYTGRSYDRIMVNTYKALNFAVLGDRANARVEFNRALQRQSDAKQIFARQTEELRQTIAAEEARYGQYRMVDRSLNSGRLDRALSDKYRNLDSLAVYADFVNPFTTYVAGLYFWLSGDRDKAVDILKEAYAMSGRHPVVADDFRRADRGIAPSGEVWVIFENGLAPRRAEVRIDLPILIEAAPVYYVGAAFPELLPGREAYPFVTVESDSGSPVSTESIADMDAVIYTDFKKELSAITAREVARAALKTYFQYEMRERYGTGGGIIAGIYQAATTRADLRMWSALPTDFQLAHLRMPHDRKVVVQPAGGTRFPINIPDDCRNVIIYIRSVAKGVYPAIDLIKF